jgi:hypothetical protein
MDGFPIFGEIAQIMYCHASPALQVVRCGIPLDKLHVPTVTFTHYIRAAQWAIVYN